MYVILNDCMDFRIDYGDLQRDIRTAAEILHLINEIFPRYRTITTTITENTYSGVFGPIDQFISLSDMENYGWFEEFDIPVSDDEDSEKEQELMLGNFTEEESEFAMSQKDTIRKLIENDKLSILEWVYCGILKLNADCCNFVIVKVDENTTKQQINEIPESHNFRDYDNRIRFSSK